MGIFELIQHDHRAIDDLLDRLERPVAQAGFDREGRQFLLDRVESEASRHEAAEELVLWPAVRRRLPDGAALADEALEQEGDAKAVLDLLRFVKSEAELADRCAMLRALLAKHADFEERTVFPRLRRRTSWVWRTWAGMKFRAARRTGPTRPHTHGPDRPLGLVTLGAPATILDHLRDLGSRERRHPTGFESPGQSDAIAVLTAHHQTIMGFLRQIEDQADPEDTLLHEAIRELAIHDSIERQCLYPVVRVRLEDGDRQFTAMLSEHARVTRLAADLEVYRFHDEARDAWVRELVAVVRTHIEEEEGAVLPALAARMTSEELMDLGLQLESARRRAPTRPHRHAVAVGAGARLSSVLVGRLDRTRDALSHRRSD